MFNKDASDPKSKFFKSNQLPAHKRITFTFKMAMMHTNTKLYEQSENSVMLDSTFQYYSLSQAFILFYIVQNKEREIIKVCVSLGVPFG